MKLQSLLRWRKHLRFWLEDPHRLTIFRTIKEMLEGLEKQEKKGLTSCGKSLTKQIEKVGLLQ